METLVEVMILILCTAHGGVIKIKDYETGDATHLDRSYPGQALLSPVRAHAVLDLSQNIGDKEER